MKKIVSTALFAATITLTTLSCKKETTTTADGKEIVAVDNAEDANAIIEFNNSLLDKRDRRASTLTKISNYINNLPNYIAGKTPVLIPPVAMIDMSKAVEAPDALGKNKDEVKTLVATSKEKFDALKKKSDELIAYVKAEDYKDDNSAKATALIAEITKLAEEYNANEKKLSGIMTPIADGAEAIVLKDHPLKDYIIGSKGVLNDSEKLLDAIDNQVISNKFDIATFKKQYTDLEAVVKANAAREFKVDDASYSNKKGFYDSFNKKADDFLGTVRKIMRDAESSGKFTEQQAEEVYNAYDNLLSNYNNFVG